MSTHVPLLEDSTAPSPRSYIAQQFGFPSIENLDFEEWMAAASCTEETIRRLAGV